MNVYPSIHNYLQLNVCVTCGWNSAIIINFHKLLSCIICELYSDQIITVPFERTKRLLGFILVALHDTINSHSAQPTTPLLRKKNYTHCSTTSGYRKKYAFALFPKSGKYNCCGVVQPYFQKDAVLLPFFV